MKYSYLLTPLAGTLMLGMVACNDKQPAQQENTQQTSSRVIEVNDSMPPESIGIEIKTDHFIKQQNEIVKEAFVGITTSDGKTEGLYPITSTGVSTEGMMKAAQAFINALTEEQKEKTLYAFNSDEWRRWLNVDNGIIVRNGTPLREMTAEQRQLAFAMMSASLSAKGLQLSKDIMKTDQTLKELNDGQENFGEDLYFFTLMGTPSASEPWGWQLDGHHLAINYFVLGDQVVMTPTFMGGEPVVTTTGKYKGNTLFQDEQNLGLTFMQSLPENLQGKATITTKKTRPDIEGGPGSDNKVMDYEGINVSALSDNQKADLLHLIELYISNMKEGHAKVKMTEIEQHFGETYFAWRGKVDDDAVFYYRIHSPVVMIEFDHQPYVGVHGKGRGVTRDHIHTMIRTPNGNDYGKDYLQQHLDKAHSHQH